MKRIFAFIAAATLMTFAVSCQPTEEGGGQASLTAEPSALSFEAIGAAAQTVDVKVTGGVEWEYEVPEISREWLTVSREGNTLTVSVTDNLKGIQRTAMITLRATNNSEIKERTVDVLQQANPNPVEFSISVEPAYMSFVGTEAPAQDVTVTVSGGMTWEATTDVDWITITPTEGKFGVSVTDNPDGKQREGTITVTPSDSEVDPATVRVVQDGKKEFTINEEPIHFDYLVLGNDSHRIDVTAYNVTWEASVVYPEGGATDWIIITPTETYLNVRVLPNAELKERSAEVVFTTDWDKRPEVRVAVTQDAAVDHISTFTEGKDFGTGDFTVVEARTTPWQKTDHGGDDAWLQLSTEQNKVELHFMNETFAYDVDERGNAGDGFYVKMDLITPRIEWNAENYFEIADDQPYEIREYIPVHDPETGNNSLQDKFTINIGKEATSVFNKYPNAYVIEYDEKSPVNKAPLVEGTLTVTHNDGNNYTFVLDAKDDFGNVFTMDWTGDIKWNLVGSMDPE